MDKLKSKLKEAKRSIEELVEKEKSLHKKHKQQIEHVLMSIFLSDRYIKEGMSTEEIEALDSEQNLGLQQTLQMRDVYQKRINDEIEAKLKAEA